MEGITGIFALFREDGLRDDSSQSLLWSYGGGGKMAYQYPFWLKNRADAAESNAMSYSQQLEQCREKLRHVTCPRCGQTFNAEEKS